MIVGVEKMNQIQQIFMQQISRTKSQEKRNLGDSPGFYCENWVDVEAATAIRMQIRETRGLSRRC